jgi:hypothetical protein
MNRVSGAGAAIKAMDFRRNSNRARCLSDLCSPAVWWVVQGVATSSFFSNAERNLQNEVKTIKEERQKRRKI